MSLSPRPHPLVLVLAQADVLKIILDNHVRDGIEHELDVAGVSSAGEVRVDLLCLFVAIQVLKLALYVHGRFLIGVLALVVGKADGQGNALDLLSQQVLLVEKEDERGVGEPVVIADGVEQTQTLCHATLWEVDRQVEDKKTQTNTQGQK